MLPNIEEQDHAEVIADGSVLVAGRHDAEITQLVGHKPGPSAAEDVLRGFREALLEGIEGAELVCDGGCGGE